MTFISLILTDRCSVSRGTKTIDQYGSQKTTWGVVATDVPCAYVRESYLDSYADTAGTSSKSSGSFYCEGSAVVPGDTVTLESGTKLSILPAGGEQKDYLSHPTHAEYAAKEVA